MSETLKCPECKSKHWFVGEVLQCVKCGYTRPTDTDEALRAALEALTEISLLTTKHIRRIGDYEEIALAALAKAKEAQP